MPEDWLSRWRQGRTGWHQNDGHPALRKFWPELPETSRVLVPLCGKSPDMLWLASQGYDVTGVELSSIAIEAFFAEANLRYQVGRELLPHYRCQTLPLTLVCGDYFEYQPQHERRFDALYDRASLVALPASERPRYVEHTRNLLTPLAVQLLITLEYDQSRVDGPPFSVSPDEVGRYWADLERVDEYDDIGNSPPKFREAGLLKVIEAVWLSRRAGSSCIG